MIAKSAGRDRQTDRLRLTCVSAVSRRRRPGAGVAPWKAMLLRSLRLFPIAALLPFALAAATLHCTGGSDNPQASPDASDDVVARVDAGGEDAAAPDFDPPLVP